MPLVLNDYAKRMKYTLVKPEQMFNLSSLNTSYKLFKKINDEIPVEEQLKMYIPRVIDLEEEGDEKKVFDPYNMTELSNHIAYVATGTLTLDDTISLEERRLRKIHSHKPDFCGTCKQEQRFDGNKYCHNCQRDPKYNPDNLLIGNCAKKEYDPKMSIDDLEGYSKYKDFMKNH